MPFGPIVQDVLLGGAATISVVVVRGSATQSEGHAEFNYRVGFRVIGSADAVLLDRSEAQSDQDGLAAVTLSIGAGAAQRLYQVEASAEGTCPINFTIDATRPLRQLRAVIASPFDTFTHSRIPIVVEATTNGNGKLSGETISFSLGGSATGETVLSPISGQSPGPTLSAQTDGTGRAVAMLSTGTHAISQLDVTAKMAGTAPAIVRVRIHDGGGKPCGDSSDCPLGYNCNTALHLCEPPPPTPPTSGCKAPADCQAPTICDSLSGRCLEATGGTCDPVEGTGCGEGEVCVGSQCAKLPAGCANNTDCPPSWVCGNGQCRPDGKPPVGGCLVPKDCPANQTCVNGVCQDKATCSLAHAPDRLRGAWQFDSTHDLRGALGGFSKGLLSAAGALRDLIEGRFDIKGIPSFIEKAAQSYLKKLMDKFVPPWGQQAIAALGNLNDIIDDMRVVSSVQFNGVGEDRYVISERWELVEFEYKGIKISAPPSAIPEIGEIRVENYTATESCGRLFLAKHEVKNKVGGLVTWAVQTALSLTTCQSGGISCSHSLEQALQGSLDCGMLAMQLDQLLMSLWSDAPSIANLVQPACELAKDTAVKALSHGLDDIKTKLTFFKLSGTARIPNPGQDGQLEEGRWSGTLGYPLLKGDFSGTFKAVR